MQATNVIVAIIAAHLLCFGVLAFLMGSRLPQVHGTKDLGYCNVLLSASFVMQLLGHRPDWSVMGVANHTMSVLAPVLLYTGLRRFLGEPAPGWPVLWTGVAGYTAAQVILHPLAGPEARYVLLAACAVVVFSTLAVTMWRAGSRHAADRLKVPLRVLAATCAGVGLLHALKAGHIIRDGITALDPARWYQLVFYGYVSVMAVVLAPLITWMVFIRLTRELEAAVVHDPLTGVLNRRGMTRRLSEHLAGCSSRGAVLLLLDLDHFKAINDTHGHRAGDDALCGVADALRAHVRAGDLVARTGGEEFVVGCLDADADEAASLAERLRAVVEAVEIVRGDAATGVGHIVCTVSVGVSRSFLCMEGFDSAFQDADAAMYAAKQAGRNRVTTAESLAA